MYLVFPSVRFALAIFLFSQKTNRLAKVFLRKTSVWLVLPDYEAPKTEATRRRIFEVGARAFNKRIKKRPYLRQPEGRQEEHERELVLICCPPTRKFFMILLNFSKSTKHYIFIIFVIIASQSQFFRFNSLTHETCQTNSSNSKTRNTEKTGSTRRIRSRVYILFAGHSGQRKRTRAVLLFTKIYIDAQTTILQMRSSGAIRTSQ